MLARWEVRGPEELSERSVRGRVRLLEGRPFDPASAARSRAGIDSLYKERGHYFSEVSLRVEPRDDGSVVAIFDIEEGRKIALSQVVVEGSEDADELVVGELDFDLIQEVRDTWQFYRDRRPETYENMVKLLP